VTHPGPGSREGTPSIAAVVASVDKDFVQYPASLRIQQSRKEVRFVSHPSKHALIVPTQILDELTDMMIERLQAFQRRSKNVLPQRIFVFRDGVSEVALLLAPL
jgi:predicted nucleic acid-binding protein